MLFPDPVLLAVEVASVCDEVLSSLVDVPELDPDPDPELLELPDEDEEEEEECLWWCFRPFFDDEHRLLCECIDRRTEGAWVFPCSEIAASADVARMAVAKSVLANDFILYVYLVRGDVLWE